MTPPKSQPQAKRISDQIAPLEIGRLGRVAPDDRKVVERAKR